MLNVQYNLGFIGGSIHSAVGAVHKIASQMDSRFCLVSGCFSSDYQTSLLTGKEWGIDEGRIYSNWIDFIEQEHRNLDAVSILTPTPMHYDMINYCLEKGVPVISEKPLSKSVEEGKNLKKLINDNKLFFAITYNYTGYPAVRELKQIVKQETLGKINQIIIEMPQEGFLKVDNKGEPVVPQNWRLMDYDIPSISLDLGVHLSNMIYFLINEYPVEIFSVEKSYGNFSNIIDDVNVIAKYDNGIICNMWYSKSALGNRNGLKIRVFFQRGSAVWVQQTPEDLFLFNNRGDSKVINRGCNDSYLMNIPRYNRFKSGHPSGFIEAFSNIYFDIHSSLFNYKSNGFDDHLNEYSFGINESVNDLVFMDSVHASSLSKNTTFPSYEK